MGHADLTKLFVLAYLDKEREHPHLLHAAQLGVKDVYRSRMDPEQIKEYQSFLTNAKRSLFLSESL